MKNTKAAVAAFMLTSIGAVLLVVLVTRPPAPPTPAVLIGTATATGPSASGGYAATPPPNVDWFSGHKRYERISGQVFIDFDTCKYFTVGWSGVWPGDDKVARAEMRCQIAQMSTTINGNLWTCMTDKNDKPTECRRATLKFSTLGGGSGPDSVAGAEECY